MLTHELSVGRYDISDEVLNRLTSDQRAMFGILCLVLSEIEGLRKVLALAGNQPTGLDELDQATISQRTVFLRLISMKLLEAFDTLMLKGKHNNTSDKGLIEFRDTYVKQEFNTLKTRDGYREARTQRKKMGFHYDLEYFRELVELPGVRAGHTIFINGGANFQSLPYGEILVTLAFGKSKNSFDLTTARAALELQTKFIQSQIQCFSRVFQAFFDKFLHDKIECRAGTLRVPKTLVARRGLDPYPFVVTEEDLQ